MVSRRAQYRTPLEGHDRPMIVYGQTICYRPVSDTGTRVVRVPLAGR